MTLTFWSVAPKLRSGDLEPDRYSTAQAPRLEIKTALGPTPVIEKTALDPAPKFCYDTPIDK